MAERPDFQFVTAAACRDPRVDNCPQVAMNIPGTVALRDSKRPDNIVTMSIDDWRVLTEAVKAGEFDLPA
jgi:hypothetical protein